MRKPVVLITGAGGEIGHGLVTRLSASGSPIITLDVTPLDAALAPLVTREFTGSITDVSLLDRDPRGVRGRSRVSPGRAALDAIGIHAGRRRTTSTSKARSTCSSSRSGKASRTAGRSSSSIPRRSPPTACPTSRRKRARARVNEDEYTHPTTMYGCNKLYCEQLGRYYAQPLQAAVGRRASRASTSAACGFPGLISAVTMPSGGTSDYAPEMIHAAAKGRALRVLRAAGHDDSVHGDARRRRRAARAGGGAARAADADGLQPRRVQPVGRRDPRGRARRVSAGARSLSRRRRNGRASSTRGRRMWTIRRRAPTGASRRTTISTARSASI